MTHLKRQCLISGFNPPSAGLVLEDQMNEYLSAADLAELVGCKPNQRAMMARWLNRHGWRYVVDKNGVPRVLRAYRDKKLGAVDGQQKAGLTSGPNRQAFTRVGEDRRGQTVQTRRQAAH
ncbi:DUF4224 domain-containing protein [Achromobacter mucicolens]|uniref:DUF4224 domain-containing protein n=2 Tax=Achromobacter mucicolens TaxID=1389922 RepID=UPI0035E4241A